MDHLMRPLSLVPPPDLMGKGRKAVNWRVCRLLWTTLYD